MQYLASNTATMSWTSIMTGRMVRMWRNTEHVILYTAPDICRSHVGGIHVVSTVSCYVHFWPKRSLNVDNNRKL